LLYGPPVVHSAAASPAVPLGARVCRIAATALLGVGVGVAASPPPSGTRPVVEQPAYRLVDHLDVAPPPGVLHGIDLERGRERRRTVVSPATFATVARPAERGPFRGYRVDAVPADVRAWGVVDVVRTVNIGTPITTTRRLDLATEAAPFLLAAPTEPRAATAIVLMQNAGPLERFDTDTRPFVAPPDAVLAFGLAAQPAHAAAQPATRALVQVIEGATTHELWSDTVVASDGSWRDLRVSLAAWAGRTIRLRFASRAPGGTASGFVAAFGEPTVLAPRAMAAPPPSVLLVSMDTLRAQSVGAYGCARPTTPALDALAAEGALFENAFSSAAYTLPAHVSLLWGRDVRSHRVIVPATVVPPEDRSVAEVLHAAGWATAAVSSAAVWLTPAIGFRRGFDAFVEHPPPYHYPAEPAYPGFTRGLGWVAAQGRRPFFAFLHNFQVHRPYLPPPEYAGLFAGASPRAAIEAEQLAYEREVRYGDDQLRALLDALDWLGLRDRTLVIVTADHGEAFFEHGWVEHTYDVHDEIARVPLVMRLPGAIPAGRRVAEPVSLIDVAPTILDLLGLPHAERMDGTSLLPLLTGAAERLPRAGVFTEAWSARGVGWTDLTAVHTRTHTCIHHDRRGDDECWDRRVDPWQRAAPLDPADPSPGVAEARAAIARHLERPPAMGSLEQDTDPKRREQLRALGYVD
jgi:arylsulfatase A-like enzyme